MSDYNTKQYPQSPYTTSIIIPKATRTPVSHHEPTQRQQFISPIQDFGNGAQHDDSIGIYSNPENFPLTPIKEGFTPINLATITRQTHLNRHFTSPSYCGENPFERTPINGPKIPRQNLLGVEKYRVLDFSPDALLPSQKQEYVENASESKHHKQIKFGPDRKLLFNYRTCNEEEQEQEDQDEVKTVKKNKRSKKNSSKGLKTLSVTVAQITKEYLKVTYKDIANLLITRFINEGKIPPTENIQDIQNAKRRVYDALNVLIAANVLVKQGKLVSPAPVKQITQNQIIKNQQKQSLITQIQQRRKRIALRKAKIMQLQQKYYAAFCLQRRNQSSPAPEQTRIQFPFVFVAIADKAKYKITQKTQTNLTLQMDSPFKFCGDIDMVIKLNLPRQKMPEIINKDLTEYMKKIRKQHLMNRS